MQESSIFDVINPPLPITKNYYRCDKRFHYELIEPLFQEYESIGIVIVLGESEKMYKVNGTKITKVQSNTLNRQKAQKKGGQSAPRIGRIQKAQVKHYTRYISEMIKEHYYIENKLNVKYIILCGVDYLCRQILDEIKESKIIIPDKYMVDLNEILEWNKSNYKDENDEIVDKLIERMQLLDPLIIYGKDEIIENSYKIEKLYVLEKIKELEIEQIIVQNYKLEEIGGAIGIAYYG